MKMKAAFRTLAFALCIWRLCHGFTVQQNALIIESAEYFSKSNVVVHLPKNVRVSQIVHVQRSLTTIDHHATSYAIQNYENASWSSSIHDQDLQFFILQDQESFDILQLSLQKRTKTSKEFWIIDITDLERSLQEISQMFSTLPLDIDDDIFICINKGRTFDIWEIYKHDPLSLKTIIKYLGKWSSQSGFTMTTVDKWRRRGDLTGHTFKVASLPSRPYITEMTPIGDGLFNMTGMFAEVFDNLQDIMNFTYDLVQPEDQQWGAIQPDGSWNGMIGQLAAGEIDIAATDFTITMERSAVMTFANPITEIYHCLFIKNPSEAYNFMAYLEPLNLLSWIMIISAILILPPFLAFFSTWPKEQDAISSNEFTLGKSYIFFLNTLTMRGWSQTPSKSGCKIAFFSFLVFGSLIYWHWEAMLISYLSTRVIVLPFKSISELVSKSPFRIILNPGTSYEDAFKTSKDPDWMEAWTSRVQPHLEEFRGEGQEVLLDVLLQDESSALYDNYYSIISFPVYEKCQVIAVPAKYDFKPYAYGFQKDSPFLPLFNYYIKEMKEKGSLKQILEKYESPPQVCPDLNGKPLGFGNCFTAFGVLCCGIGFGFILFGIEIFSDLIGLDNPILNSFGSADFDEINFARLLNRKDEKIASLEMQIKQLRQEKSKLSWIS